MLWDVIVRISNITASDILLQVLPDGEPDLLAAAELSEMLMREHGMYADTGYIYGVWARRDASRGDPDQRI